MTIDEAIEKESKIAKENQKIVDTQIVFDNVSISELYCDDTEVIEEHLSNYKKCAEYHEQIAEWLEELKDCRDKNKMVVRVDVENMDSIKDKIEELSKYAESKYNKALDDFVKALQEKIEKDLANPDLALECKKCGIWKNYDIKEIAEQLKAGVTND